MYFLYYFLPIFIYLWIQSTNQDSDIIRVFVVHSKIIGIDLCQIMNIFDCLLYPFQRWLNGFQWDWKCPDRIEQQLRHHTHSFWLLNTHLLRWKFHKWVYFEYARIHLENRHNFDINSLSTERHLIVFNSFFNKLKSIFTTTIISSHEKLPLNFWSFFFSTATNLLYSKIDDNIFKQIKFYSF